MPDAAPRPGRTGPARQRARPVRGSLSRGPGRPSAAAAPDAQRARILEVAAAHFARHGFAGASLRDMAEDVGLSHAMIRHLFGAKEALWDAAAEHLFARMRAAMATALDGIDPADPVQRMAAQVRASARTAARVPSLAGFVMQAGLAGGARYEALVERHLRPLHAFALEPYRQLAATGRAAPIPEHFIFLMATNAAINPFAQAANSRALAGIELADPAVAEAYADALIAILLHGLLRQPPAAGAVP